MQTFVIIVSGFINFICSLSCKVERMNEKRAHNRNNVDTCFISDGFIFIEAFINEDVALFFVWWKEANVAVILKYSTILQKSCV